MMLLPPKYAAPPWRPFDWCLAPASHTDRPLSLTLSLPVPAPAFAALPLLVLPCRW